MKTIIFFFSLLVFSSFTSVSSVSSDAHDTVMITQQSADISISIDVNEFNLLLANSSDLYFGHSCRAKIGNLTCSASCTNTQNCVCSTSSSWLGDTCTCSCESTEL